MRHELRYPKDTIVAQIRRIAEFVRDGDRLEILAVRTALQLADQALADELKDVQRVHRLGRRQ
jgi:hypothetical protein